jgi:hypothetical protein
MRARSSDDPIIPALASSTEWIFEIALLDQVMRRCAECASERSGFDPADLQDAKALLDDPIM